MREKNVSRRQFLRRSAAGSLGILASVAPGRARVAADGKIRWGIIGVGNRSSAHIRAFNELDFCEITGLCDIRPEALERGLQRVKGNRPKIYERYQELLRQQDVDAVCIITPNHLHKQMTLDSLAAGKHVLCEKPMAVTLAECEEVAALARKSAPVLQYGMQLRHTPRFIKVSELVQGGAIGNIRYAWVADFRKDIRQLHEDPAVDRTTNWRYFQETSGGMLLEYSIHRLDLLNWWMNSRPLKVAALGGHNVWRDRETIDHCSMLIEYANGARATYGMTLYSPGYGAPWVLMGDEGQMLVERGGRIVIQKGDVSSSLGGPKVRNTEEVIEVPEEGDGTVLQYLHFARAVKGEVQPYPDWKIAYDAMRVGVSGEEAIRSEKIVDL